MNRLSVICSELLVLLLTVSSVGFTQQKVVDSLENLINTSVEPYDTNYVDLRNEYIRQKIFTSPSDSTLLPFTLSTVEMTIEMGYLKGEVMAYQRLGNLYQYFLAQPLKAIDYYQKAIEIMDKQPELKSYTPASLNNIAGIYYEQQEFEKALTIYRRVRNGFEKNTIASQYIGNIYGSLEEYDSAIFYFKIAIDEAKNEKNYNVQAYAYSALSLMLSRVGKTEEAKINTEESLTLINEHGLELVRTAGYLNAAIVYLKNNNYDKAEFYSNDALKLIQLTNNLFYEQSIYGTLYEVYEAKKDFQSALEAFKKFTELNDSISNEDRRLETARKEIEFEAKKKQLAAQLQIEEQKSFQNLIVVVASCIVIILVAGFILYRQKQLAFTKANEATFKADLTESKLVALRTQLNPHFIFNALNSIDQYMGNHGVKLGSSYLVKFSKLMRSILENSERNWITLAEELESISLYIEIEALRLNHNLTYDINLDKSIDQENTLIPSLVLQPFVENSIVHGISKKEAAGHISLTVKRENNQLVCIVDDNGIGRKKAQNSKFERDSKSMGMAIAKTRIDYLNQNTFDQSELEILDKEEGVRITLKVPLKFQF